MVAAGIVAAGMLAIVLSRETEISDCVRECTLEMTLL